MLAAAAVIAAAAVGGARIINAAHRAPNASLSVTRSTHGQAIPPGFLGLSMEYRGLAAYAGPDPSNINPVFEQLLRNLAGTGNPELRIGGDSTDWTWWPVRGATRPPGVKYDLTPAYLAVLHDLVTALHARLLLGVNLEANNTRDAAAEASAFMSHISRSAIDGLEIGNEPELYGSFSWYKAPNGQHVDGRPHGYGFPQFLGDFSRFATAIPKGAPLAGPSAGGPSILSNLGRFLSAERRVGVATIHAYPLKNCTKHNQTSISQLLSPAAAGGLAASVTPYVRIAHGHHVALRIDEMNAVSCGGQRGVSNVFASALWALNALFQMARAGVDGVNIHTVPDTINELIGVGQSGGHWFAVVHPQYYGMMMFAQAAPAGSRLLRIAGKSSGLSVWATRAPDGNIRVTLINDTPGQTGTATLRIAGASGSATVERLGAPSLSAQSGITLGGQSFGSRTGSGQLAGSASNETVAPNGDVYKVSVPGGSAALLTVR